MGRSSWILEDRSPFTELKGDHVLVENYNSSDFSKEFTALEIRSNLIIGNRLSVDKFLIL